MISKTTTTISRTADIGGRKILGVNNLSSYIWNGNKLNTDKFEKSEKKNNVIKTLGVLGSLGLAVTAIIAGIKGGFKGKGKQIKSSKLFNFDTTKIKNSFNKLKTKFTKIKK